jgi:tetratricopeptide (TPR) repeat protein
MGSKEAEIGKKGSMPIVQQTSGSEVMTQVDRDYWVQLRKKSNNDHTKLYAILGTKDWSAAVEESRNYLKKKPRDRVAMTVLAIGLAMQKNYKLAAYYAKVIEKYYPGYPETHNLMGLATLNRVKADYEDYQEAVRYFSMAFEADEQQIASGFNLGHLYLQLGQAKAAQEVFETLKERCLDCNEANLGYAIASSRMRQFGKSEKALNTILKRDKNNPEALYYLAIIENYGRKRPKKALDILAKVVADPNDRALAVKRKANFLLRRLQASQYARNPKKQQIDDSHLQEAPQEVINALDKGE